MSRVMNRFIGADTFIDLLAFLESFSTMFAGFKVRASRVAAMLRAPSTCFVVVSSTEVVSLDEAVVLHEQLEKVGMPFGALLVNRVRPSYVAPEALDGLAARLLSAANGVEDLGSSATIEHAAERIEQACRDYAMLAEIDAARISEVQGRLGESGSQVWTVPLFDGDVHDIESLAAFADHVFDG